MGELMGVQGGKLEGEQGLGIEACQRWLGRAQGESTVVPAGQQAVIDGLGKTNLAQYPVMHLVENKPLDKLHAFKEGMQASSGDHKEMISGATSAHHMQQARANLALCHSGFKGQWGITAPQ